MPAIHLIAGISYGSTCKEDVKSITELHLSGMGITNLSGIGYFISLFVLDVSYNNLTELDLSSNHFLQMLNVEGNPLLNFDAVIGFEIISYVTDDTDYLFYDM